MAGRSLSAANMCCNPTINTFTQHWKYLIARKDATNHKVTKILKTLHIMNCTKAFPDFSRRVIGTRTVTLSYIIIEYVSVTDLASPLMTNQTYANEFRSVEEDLIACAMRTHPL